MSEPGYFHRVTLLFKHFLYFRGRSSRRLTGGARAQINQRAILDRKRFGEFFHRTGRAENHFMRLINRLDSMKQGADFGRGWIAGKDGTAGFFKREAEPLQHKGNRLWKLLEPAAEQAQAFFRGLGEWLAVSDLAELEQ